MRFFNGGAAKALLVTLFGIVFLLFIFKYGTELYGKFAASFFFSALIPIAFLLARRQTREDRIHAAEVFRRTYDGSLSSSVYFEFFERKYCPGNGASNPAMQGGKFRDKYPASDASAWLLLGASLPFIIFTAAGVFVLLIPAEELAKLAQNSLGISLSGSGPNGSKIYENALAIASLAFVSAYLYSLRSLFKTLLAYNPFGVAFLRAFGHMLFAVLLAVMLWRVAPDTRPLEEAAVKVQNSIVSGNRATVRPNAPASDEARNIPQAQDKLEEMNKLWLILAVIIGFLPDYTFSWLLQRVRTALSSRYRIAAKRAAIAPLTVIDGIDFAKAYRLGEANIVDVQNLAASNPVMLHVETSYCMFLIMDWVAQAQLCASVGSERFLLFKKINIRTIFDLERAVLDPCSPPGLKQIAGAVLLASDSGKANVGVRPLDMSHRDFDRALTSCVNAEVIEHLVRVMMDNLHICRLRQLWNELEASLPPAQTEKVARTPKILPAASAQPNGGGRETHSPEIAAQGKAGAREMSGIHTD